MKVVSTSPDTGQHGGATSAWRRAAHALSGKTVRALVHFFIMTICFPHARRTCLLAAAAFLALPVLAQPRLAETVVTATRTAQPLSDLVADVSVLDRDEIERSGAAVLSDLLARLPGLEIVRNGGPGANTSLYIRGAESRYTAVYVDGVRVDSQATGGAQWESIPLALVDRIEVLRGPASAVYGSDALAGVVQIFTRKGEGGFAPYVSTGLGTYSTRKTDAGFSGSHEAFDYALGLGDESSKGFNTRPVAGQNPDDDGYNRQSANARLGWQLNRSQRVEATGLSSNMNSQYDTSAKDDRNLHQLQTLGMNWQARWTEAYNTRLSVTDSRSRYETEPSVYKTITHLRGYLLQNELRVGSQLFTALLERREDKLDNASTTPKTTERSQNGVGLGYGLSERQHTLQLQARQDQDSEFGAQGTGSVAYGYAPTSRWRFTASASTAFRAPTLYQRFSVYGVSTLKPESSRNLELGVRHGDGQDSWSLVVYRNMVENLITFATPGPCASSIGCYANTAQADYEGMTLSGEQHAGSARLRASLDVQDPRDRSTGNLLARRASHHAMLGVDTRAGAWVYGAESQLSGARYDTAANTTVLPGYALFNLYARASLARDWSLLLRVDNATDTSYQLASGYATAGRTFYVGLSWAPGPIGAPAAAAPATTAAAQ